MTARHVYMVCGPPSPGGGFFATCGTIRDLEAAATCATRSVLARNRLEWLGLKLGRAIDASEGNNVVLDRKLAVVMRGYLADAEFEASERIEAECDLATSPGARS